MTREELVQMREYKVAQASTEYWNKNKCNDDVSIITAFEDGAEWADAHPISPWISVEELLPEIEDEKEERTGEVFVCIKDGVYLVAHYSYFYKAWYAFDDRGGCMYRKIRTPRYWMSIPELKKGE